MSDIKLIGLPYQFGRRSDDHGYQMARGPEVLLGPGAAPEAFDRAFGPTEIEWLDDLDDAKANDPGARPMSPGDQMVRQLVQNNGLSAAVRDAKARGLLPVVAAGGCNSSIGTVGGLDDPGLGMIWFDAHHDAETPETSSDGLFEGMPVSVIAGRCWTRWSERIDGFHVMPESHIMQVGLHDHSFVDPRDKDFRGIGHIVDPVAMHGSTFEKTFAEALTALRRHVDRVYVHVDTDVIDASYMRGNLHAATGGPSPDQVRWALDRAAGELRIEALSFTSYDVAVDPNAPATLVPLMTDLARAALRSRD